MKNLVAEQKPVQTEKKFFTDIEEYLKLPKERRDKAEAELKYFFDNAETLIPQAIKETVREQLDSGFPIAYGDGKGNVLQRYPDGKIFLAKVDMKTYEITETFLRMATPEDDIGIYD